MMSSSSRVLTLKKRQLSCSSGHGDGEEPLVMKLVMEDDKYEQGKRRESGFGFGLVMERIAFVNFANENLTYFIKNNNNNKSWT